MHWACYGQSSFGDVRKQLYFCKVGFGDVRKQLYFGKVGSGDV